MEVFAYTYSATFGKHVSKLEVQESPALDSEYQRLLRKLDRSVSFGFSLQKEADVLVAQALGSRLDTARAHLEAARFLMEARTKDAVAHLRNAKSILLEIDRSAPRTALELAVSDLLSELLLESDTQTAISEISSALEIASRTRRNLIPKLLERRARAHLLLDNVALARADLNRALETYESRHCSAPQEPIRAEFFEYAQTTFERAILATLDEPIQAFTFAERSRRSLKELAIGIVAPGKVLDIEGLLAQLPRDTAHIEFAVLPDHLVTWTIYQGQLFQSVTSIEGLEKTVDELWRLLGCKSASESEIAELTAILSRQLVEPWIQHVDSASTLVFIPDRFLHAVPFTMLREPASGQYLAARFRIALTQNVLSQLSPGYGTRPHDLLLIGDAAFDPSMSDQPSSISRLPGARNEILQISSIYDDSVEARVALGDHATRGVFLEGLKQYTSVHYAGHAWKHHNIPWDSSLPFAPEANGTGESVLAREIFELPHSGPQLVILSACGAPSRGGTRAAAFTPLVSALLEIGTQQVIYSHWPVDDDSIVKLSVELHRGLAAGLTPLEALHQARLAYLEESPRLWASLNLAYSAGGLL